MENASRLAIVSSPLAILPASALAKTLSKVADQVGAKGTGGETQRDQHGYEWVGNAHNTLYWWNASEQACISPLFAEERCKTITGEAAAKSTDRVAQGHLPTGADACRRLSQREGDVQ